MGEHWKRCECCGKTLTLDDDDAGWVQTLDECDLCPCCADGLPSTPEEGAKG